MLGAPIGGAHADGVTGGRAQEQRTNAPMSERRMTDAAACYRPGARGPTALAGAAKARTGFRLSAPGRRVAWVPAMAHQLTTFTEPYAALALRPAQALYRARRPRKGLHTFGLTAPRLAPFDPVPVTAPRLYDPR